MHNQFKTQKFKHLMLAMGPRDLNSAPYSPVHCSSHLMTSFQSSVLTELPVAENSARYAPCGKREMGAMRPTVWRKERNEVQIQDGHTARMNVHARQLGVYRMNEGSRR